MQRISSPTAVAALPAPVAGGVPGFFAQVTPGIGLPTIMSPDWANSVQEEVVALALSGGQTLNAASLTQARDGIMAFGYFQDTGAVNAYVISTEISGVADGQAFTLPAVDLMPGVRMLILAAHGNTGPSNVTIDGTQYAWTNNADGALVSGDIVGGSIYPVIYDGTQIRMQAVTNGQIAAQIAAAVAAALAAIGTATSTTITVASHAYVAADAPAGSKMTIYRSNGGAAMIDSFPGHAAGALPAGWSAIVVNADATALLALKVGAGSTLTGPGVSNGYIVLGPGQQAPISCDGTNYTCYGAPARARLTANTQLFFGSAGSDIANTGLTNTSPFATSTHAHSWAQDFLDVAGFQLTILGVGAGSFPAAAFNGPLVGQTSPVIVQGAGSASTTFPNGISCSGGANVQVAAMTTASSSSGSGALVANDIGTKITLGAGVVFAASIGTHIQCNTGALIYLANSYTISGGAAAHILQLAGGIVDVDAAITVTLTGTPVWSVAGVISEAGGVVNFGSNVTWSGAASGQRFQTIAGGVINTNGAGVSWLPGSTAGTGAWYF